MAGNDVFLNQGAANPNDVVLRDPLTNSIVVGGVSVSSATTDAADVTTANAGPVVAASSASTDGQDVTASSVATAISTTSATTDGADITAASVDVVVSGVSVSSATTDGADVSASSVGVSVSASSATTNGQDTTAGSVATQVAASSATTNSADVTAASAGVLIGASSATTDGADTTQSLVEVTAPTTAPGYSSEVILRKWYVRRDNKLHVFATGDDADAFIEADDKANIVIAQAQKTSRLARKRLRDKVISVAAPESTVQIDYLAQLVSRYAIPINLPELVAQQDWERVMEIMAIALQAQDDEDIEMLLLAC